MGPFGDGEGRRANGFGDDEGLGRCVGAFGEVEAFDGEPAAVWTEPTALPMTPRRTKMTMASPIQIAACTLVGRDRNFRRKLRF